MANRPISWSDARDRLHQLRDKQERASYEIVQLAEPLLTSSASKLGDEVWAVYEQACVAALDCNRSDFAEICHKKLEEKFGRESARVGILDGQRLESAEKWAEAEKRYKELLELHPTNAKIMKRQIALLIGQQKIRDAIRQMNKYIENFMGDAEAWTELASLYLKENRFDKAQFCYEELIILNPYNHNVHERYAEVLYTQGGTDNLALARTHFAQAANLNPKSARALYGLALTSAKTANAKGSVSSEVPATALVSTAVKKLETLYKGAPNAKIAQGFGQALQ
eukprot:m.113858 g.113858  ORF g.113858 m.113858 type:complete len:282 (+) comp17106_c0_seq1:232-1077(+)